MSCYFASSHFLCFLCFFLFSGTLIFFILLSPFLFSRLCNSLTSLFLLVSSCHIVSAPLLLPLLLIHFTLFFFYTFVTSFSSYFLCLSLSSCVVPSSSQSSSLLPLFLYSFQHYFSSTSPLHLSVIALLPLSVPLVLYLHIIFLFFFPPFIQCASFIYILSFLHSSLIQLLSPSLKSVLSLYSLSLHSSPFFSLPLIGAPQFLNSFPFLSPFSPLLIIPSSFRL